SEQLCQLVRCLHAARQFITNRCFSTIVVDTGRRGCPPRPGRGRGGRRRAEGPPMACGSLLPMETRAGDIDRETGGFHRYRSLERLAAEQFDVLVIGGGITGAGVAL